jgi:hypothetical protein
MRFAGALAFALLAGLFATAAHASDDADEDAPKPHVDRGRPGRPLVYAAPPEIAAPMRVCSLHLPLCVHAERAAAPATVLAVLSAAERAYTTLTGAMELPPPDVDPATLAYPIYLVSPASELASTELAARDVRGTIDRARAFTLVDSRARPSCMLDAAMARALARAVLYRVAPAMDKGTVRAQTTYLSQIAVPCALAFSADAALAFQSNPDRAVADAHASDPSAAPADWATSMSAYDRLFADGASIAWSRIDWAFGRTPGGLVRASWALAPSKTPLGAPFWRDEPDPYDVLRESFKSALWSGSTLADLLLDLSVARAFVGTNDDGAHQPELRTLGDAAKVPFDWDIAWPTKPRRLSPRAPVMPTGASYIVVRRAGAAPASRLRVEISWEEHALFRWALVKLDASGKEIGRVLIPMRERAVEAQMTLVDLEKVDRVLVVGVNAGDPTYHFDPDDEVWEPHAWVAAFAEEP